MMFERIFIDTRWRFMLHTPHIFIADERAALRL